jgi:hypothetical protein
MHGATNRASAVHLFTTQSNSRKCTSGRRVRSSNREHLSRQHALDGLIKSLIDLPPSTAEATASRDDTKRSLNTRIGELTELVNAMREQLSALEVDAEVRAKRAMAY